VGRTLPRRLAIKKKTTSSPNALPGEEMREVAVGKLAKKNEPRACPGSLPRKKKSKREGDITLRRRRSEGVREKKRSRGKTPGVSGSGKTLKKNRTSIALLPQYRQTDSRAKMERTGLPAFILSSSYVEGEKSLGTQEALKLRLQ